MKQTSPGMNRNPFAQTFAIVMLFSLSLVACTKSDPEPKNAAGSYSAEVLDKWMTLQLRLMRNTPGVPNHGFTRHFAYAGVAALESLKPGLNGSYKWSERWNGLSGLPASGKAKSYFLPANVNAALAAVNKALFATAIPADKAAIDSLEQALNASFQSNNSSEVMTTSLEFGKAVAAAVITWAQADGASNANAPYTVPTGPGLWQPTAPSFSAPATPYWSANRPMVKGSTTGTLPQAPLAFSSEPGSPFYNMVKEVYDASQNLTNEQKEMAIFWRDVPGQTSPGHWLSILQSAIRSSSTKLDEAALAYALTGCAMNDAMIACFAAKYQFKLLRPITYIRDVMGHTSWLSHIGTPAHPEYPSSHSALSASAAAVLQQLFGNSGSITDHTYDYLGFAPRTYSSFTAIGEEAGRSRLYAGIHYTPSIDAGLVQGRKVTSNIFNK